MRTSQGYDELHTIPRDVISKRVVFDAGDHYSCIEKLSTGQYFSTTPLPIRDQKKLPIQLIKDPSYKDFTGHIFGNFTVIGMFALHKYDKWVMRCCCGNYEIRTTRTLNLGLNKIDQDRCQECIDLERLRNKDYFKQHGIYPWQIEGPKRKNRRRRA